MGSASSRAIVAIGALTFAGCLLLAWRGGLRPPAVHDEFSYLLAADTFQHGRLTNPTPPAWRSFETEHVVVRPTYMSKYPPGQGLFLAVGGALTGQPIAGVWLSLALACAAITWMLLAWVPVRWAFAGGLVALAQFVFLGEDGWWSQRYWGGAVALLGGALLVGAWRRLSEHATPANGLVLALGLLILANSRPFEGAMVSLPVIVDLIWRARRQPELRSGPLLRAIALPLACGALWMGWYNFRVTGHFWLLPHLLYQHQYTASPQFLWLKPGPLPSYFNAEMARLHVSIELNSYRRLHDPAVWLGELAARWSRCWRFYLGIPFALALPALPWALDDAWTRRAALVLLWLLLCLASLTWFFPHYAAPAGAIVVLLVVQCLRRLSGLRLGKWRIGSILPLLIGALCLVQVGRTVAASKVPRDWAWHRRQIQSELATSGRHLVIVRYAAWHNVHEEWVYNAADLENSPVIWARDLGATSNGEAIRSFPGRTVWLLEPEAASPKPRPFSERD